ncbi:succinoglycan biosynthesis protein exop [Rhizobium sp. CC1099]|uniref:succinoglycan biosynthesis protein exop n=1 Tax=Rhizobium sp. CC1099 TaxID=3039160 RepID=UPI0024B19877|nr:succinoglycan biosynthesis protein exop [Rhizobium sp. CC1099]WFU87886.1 succinoglycan biosynthesis protein exop [Rhizobium sp. CC1099]
MYDSRLNGSIDRRRLATAGRADARDRNLETLPVRPSEAELLRVIGKALEEQRLQRSAPPEPPHLVDRIETILETRLRAANDVRPAEPSQHRLAAPAEARQVDAANLSACPVRRRSLVKPIGTIAVAALIGAGVPFLMPAEPAHYAAEAAFHVQAGKAERGPVTAAAVSRLLSGRTMSAAVGALKLDRDPEFTGGQSTIGVALDLLSGSGAAADAASRAEAALAGMVEANADGTQGAVRLKVTTADGAKSSRIASWLSDMLMSSGPPASAEAGAGLRKAYEDVKAQLAAFTASSGEGNVKVASDLQQRINQLDADLKIAEQRITLAKQETDRLKVAKPGDVLNGSLPLEAISPALQDARDKYVTEKATLSLLSNELGPRHPRRLGQQAVVDGLKDKVAKELARQAQDANAALKAATEARKTLNDQRNTLIAQSRDTGVDLAKLTELRDKTEAARSRMADAVTSTASIAASITAAKPIKTTAVAAGPGLPVRSAVGAALAMAIGLAGMLGLRLLRQRPARAAETLTVPEQPEAAAGELELLRDRLAGLRDRLQSHGAGHR